MWVELSSLSQEWDNESYANYLLKNNISQLFTNRKS